MITANEKREFEDFAGEEFSPVSPPPRPAGAQFESTVPTTNSALRSSPSLAPVRAGEALAESCVAERLLVLGHMLEALRIVGEEIRGGVPLLCEGRASVLRAGDFVELNARMLREAQGLTDFLMGMQVRAELAKR